MQPHETHHISLDKKEGQKYLEVGYTSQTNCSVKKGTNNISRCQIRNINVKKNIKKEMKNKSRCQIREAKKFSVTHETRFLSDAI